MSDKSLGMSSVQIGVAVRPVALEPNTIEKPITIENCGRLQYWHHSSTTGKTFPEGGESLKGGGFQSRMEVGGGGRGKMGSLPEELWVQILQTGIRNTQLAYRDMCALAMVSRRLNRICELDSVWKLLMAQDFPEPAWPSFAAALRKLGPKRAVTCTKLYRTRYTTKKRKMLRVTSSLNELQEQIRILENDLQINRDKLVSTRKELEDLERSRLSVDLRDSLRHEVLLYGLTVFSMEINLEKVSKDLGRRSFLTAIHVRKASHEILECLRNVG